MNLKLTRSDFEASGIIGSLTDETEKEIAKTLEHAYDSGNGNGSYAPKLPSGVYKCVKGEHRLAHMASTFETYEITNVPGHTNILFHTGNYNNDSEGCVLLGNSVITQANGELMLINSRSTFAKFISLEYGLDTFVLTVV